MTRKLKRWRVTLQVLPRAIQLTCQQGKLFLDTLVQLRLLEEKQEEALRHLEISPDQVAR